MHSRRQGDQLLVQGSSILERDDSLLFPVYLQVFRLRAAPADCACADAHFSISIESEGERLALIDTDTDEYLGY